MARGDGKAQRGYTRGKGVIKMAAGGNLAARDAAMGGAAVGSRAEATRGTSSGGLGASTRDGGFGGSAGSAGGGGRSDMRSPVSTAARGDYLRDATRASVRLGPNAAQAMAGAGVNPDVANLAARSINRMAPSGPSILGDTSPGQRLATYNPDGSITYSSVPQAAKRKQIYDRILPETSFPTRPISPTPKAPTATMGIGSLPPAVGRMTGAQDTASIQPGSVSFTQSNQFTPFAQTPKGMSLLEQAKQPLSYSQAQELMKSLPPGTGYTMAGKKVPEGFSSYPVTAAGFNLSVNIPSKAGISTLGPKVGTFNPTAQVATPLAGYTGAEQRFRPAAPVVGQEQRFAPAPTTKQIYDKITPGGTKQIYDRILPETETPIAPAGRPAAPSVVAGGNFSAGAFPYRERGGGEGRGIRKKKKPIVEETTTAVRDGGSIRGDGKATFGKTKGRYI